MNAGLRPRRAMTLLELLFVVAIIAVLAGICVPNFLEAQIRSKISRSSQDAHSLVLAAASYRADKGMYPPNDARVDKLMAELNGLPQSQAADFATSASVLDMLARVTYQCQLTTPVAYLPQVLQESFRGGQAVSGLAAYTLTQSSRTMVTARYGSAVPVVVISYAPDNRNNTVSPGLGPFTVYDPTNGTVSSGDLYYPKSPKSSSLPPSPPGRRGAGIPGLPGQSGSVGSSTEGDRF